MKLLVNHKYEIANGCGEYITGVITKIGRTYIYLDNCSYWTGIADRQIGKYKIAKKVNVCEGSVLVMTTIYKRLKKLC